MSSYNKIKITNSILLLIIYFFLDYYYREIVYPIFNYQGYLLNSTAFQTSISVLLIIILLVYTAVIDVSPFIYLILCVFLILLVFPNIILYGNGASSFDITLSCISLIPIMHILYRFNLFSHFFTNKKDFGKKYAQIYTLKNVYAFLGLTTVFMTPFFLTYKLNLDISSLLLNDEDIYSNRDIGLEKINIITAYTFSWLSIFIIPAGLVKSLIKKNILLFGIFTFFLVYLFLCLSMKTVILSFPIILFFFIGKDYSQKTLYFSFLLLFLLMAMLIYPSENYFLESIVVQRTFFAPALINTFYFDFFQDKHLYLSHSIFKYFINYPFSDVPAKEIGFYYFNNYNSNANNGIPSDGFMNFGYIGVLLFNIMIGLLFALIDFAKIDHRYFGIIFTFITYLIGGYFFSTILTHGGGLLIVYCIFVSKYRCD